jgi:hypothetical protein
VPPEASANPTFLEAIEKQQQKKKKKTKTKTKLPKAQVVTFVKRSIEYLIKSLVLSKVSKSTNFAPSSSASGFGLDPLYIYGYQFLLFTAVYLHSGKSKILLSSLQRFNSCKRRLLSQKTGLPQ